MSSTVVQLLLHGIRPRMDVAVLRDMVSQDTDWEALGRLARRHGVSALLARGLARAGIKAPASLTKNVRAIGYRNLRLSAELAEITNGFEADGICVLTLKGVAQSVLAYGDIGCRDSLDIDLAVHPEQLDGASAALTLMGYSELDLSISASVLGQRAFRHKERQVSIDLHGRWCASPAAFPVSFSEAWERRDSVLLGSGVSVCTLGGADRILFLCVHGGRHQWERLLWLCDIAWELDRNPDLVTSVRDRARGLGIERAFALAQDLIARLLDGGAPSSPLPTSIAVASHWIAAKLGTVEPSPEAGRLLSVLNDINLYDTWGGRLAEAAYRGRRLFPRE